ncbi:hypothetical protein ACQ5SP_08230 [Rhodovulum sp. YNF3179]|uniref:hypothetical protein n=1 Tax=Rhodovulum sp. YNF3179 TaxID=3425127 RepID=UPI003D32C274
MTFALPLTYDHIDTLAASAFAQARSCAEVLREEVIPRIGTADAETAERVVSAIERRQVFDEAVLADIDLLVDTLTGYIEAGTTAANQVIADEHHIEGGVVLTRTRRTRDAEALARAVSGIDGLRQTLLGVHDAMHAERALADMRKRA